MISCEGSVMCDRAFCKCILGALISWMCAAAQAPTHADILRGAYGPYRANNDLLFYHLNVRVDPEKKFIGGKNTIRFRMLQDGTRIQLDLHEALHVRQDSPRRHGAPLRARLRRRLRGFPGDPPRRPRVHHRLLLLGEPGRDGPVRRHRIPQGPVRAIRG